MGITHESSLEHLLSWLFAPDSFDIKAPLLSANMMQRSNSQLVHQLTPVMSDALPTVQLTIVIICLALCSAVVPSVLWHCWLGGRKGIRPVKNMGGWWRWALVSPDGVAPSRMVGVSASVNLPLHHKVQKFSSGTSLPGGPGKRAVKRLWCGGV